MTPIKRVPADQLELRWYDVTEDGYPPLDKDCDYASVDVVILINKMRKVAYHMGSTFGGYWITMQNPKKSKVIDEKLVSHWCPTAQLSA